MPKRCSYSKIIDSISRGEPGHAAKQYVKKAKGVEQKVALVAPLALRLQGVYSLAENG